MLHVTKDAVTTLFIDNDDDEQ